MAALLPLLPDPFYNATVLNLPLRPNVCILLFNQEHRLFLGERKGEPGVWQFPQGGAEPSLTLEENVLKELEEELGTPAAKFRIISKLDATNEYNFDVPPAYAEGKWRGQRQTFWLVQFLGEDEDIDLARHEQEFTDYCWCSVDEVRQRAEPKRLRGYMKPLDEFVEFLRRE